MDGRQSVEHSHLFVAEPRCYAQLSFILEKRAKVRARLARTEYDFRNSGTRFTIVIPPDIGHDTSNGRERLPLCSPPRSSATKVKPALRHALRSSDLSGSSIARSNISGGISRRTIVPCHRARAGHRSRSRKNASTASI